MIRTSKRLVLWSLVTTALSMPAAAGDFLPASDPVPNSYIVVFRDGVAARAGEAAPPGLSVAEQATRTATAS